MDHRRTGVRISVLLGVGAILLGGCGALKKKGEDAGAGTGSGDGGDGTTASADDGGGATASGDDAGGSGGTTATEGLATNENDVARFPDETKIDNVSKPILAWQGTARQAPPSGTVVAQLKKNAATTQIAQRDKYFLVTFEDPKDSTKKLMGWVIGDAFEPPKDAGPPVFTNTCPAGQTLLLADVGFCGVVCKVDKDCPAGNICTGTAQKIVKAKGMETVKNCLAAPKPPPPPAPVADAGAPKSPADAGAAPPAVADAGAAKLEIEMAPTGGKCLEKYLLVPKDGKCHLICADADGKSGAGKCGSARCTKKCPVAQPVCVTNTALCQ
jgi:hypothetical protein